MKWIYNPKLDQWTDPDGNVNSGGPEPRHAMAARGNRDKYTTAWPVLSDGAGCHPSQIQEYRKFLAGKGVEADYTPDGRLVMESHDHRKKVLKALNMVDRGKH